MVWKGCKLLGQNSRLIGLKPTKILFTANDAAPAYLSTATALLLAPWVSNLIL